MQSETVLLVEDADNDVVLMQRAWRLEGIESGLQIATDGQMAIDYLAGVGEFSDRMRFPVPRLILLDLKLPYVEGLDVLRWMRDRPELKALPVVVLTTSGLQSDVDQAYQIGANAFLIKPSNVHELSGLVRLIRDFWLRVNRFPQIETAQQLASHSH